MNEGRRIRLTAPEVDSSPARVGQRPPLERLGFLMGVVLVICVTVLMIVGTYAACRAMLR